MNVPPEGSPDERVVLAPDEGSPVFRGRIVRQRVPSGKLHPLQWWSQRHLKEKPSTWKFCRWGIFNTSGNLAGVWGKSSEQVVTKDDSTQTSQWPTRIWSDTDCLAITL